MLQPQHSMHPTLSLELHAAYPYGISYWQFYKYMLKNNQSGLDIIVPQGG